VAKPTGETRLLSYPLRHSLVPETSIEDNTAPQSPLNWPTSDNDELVTVTLTLSLNEYIALSSCIDVGDDIAYGENAILLWYIWVRSINSMELCEQVADCIDTSTVVQNSINTTVINKGSVNPNTINSETTILTDRIPQPEITPIAETSSDPCDLDAIWAGIRSMVERIDGNGRDILEDLSVINDKIQQWGELIDLVPILGDTIKDIGDLFTEQLPDMLNAYNAASSPTFLDNVACDLFAMVCEDCRYPTFDEILEYFGSHSYVAFPTIATTSYAALWQIIKLVSIGVPEALWYTINAWQCITLAFDGIFGRSYGRRSFEIWASFGEDNPNDNWIILCDGCPEPPYEILFDFQTTGDNAVPPNTMNAGSWTPNQWLGSNLANERLVYWSIPFGAGMLHNEVSVVYANTGAATPHTAYIFIQGALSNTDMPYQAGYDEQTYPIANLAGGLVKCVATTDRIGVSAQVLIYSLRFKGHGYVPAALVPYMVSGVPE